MSFFGLALNLTALIHMLWISFIKGCNCLVPKVAAYT
ncbi:hypothetical protein T01_15762 [Trichinella spiralis]|uniref:Uncharacterized protein n=1 Tax=Trichinella spiralis TaxID=6334 RepID=A0A0V1AL18_TRISP|nr:hypothetical protein T01_15762 [Trichinella spiralis]